MSDLISRCELFNRLATIPAPAEANEFKAKIYAVIQGMDATTETVERREMHKLIIRLKSGYEIPITCEDFTFKENRLSGELGDYEIKGIKDNVPLYFRLTDVDCVVENLYGTADRPQGWIPCSERLPEYRKLVLVTTRDLRVKPAYLDSIQDDGTDDWWSIPLDDTDCALWNIVAWMPLPEPMKGVDDD